MHPFNDKSTYLSRLQSTTIPKPIQSLLYKATHNYIYIENIIERLVLSLFASSAVAANSPH